MNSDVTTTLRSIGGICDAASQLSAWGRKEMKILRRSNQFQHLGWLFLD
jgi:hypothetical protein